MSRIPPQMAFLHRICNFGQQQIPLILIILAAGTLHLTTIREGHDWGDDFAMYIHHAKNIVEGVPYAKTGYLYNSSAPIAPKTYPPIFPLLLAPIYEHFGLDLKPMKILVIFFFLGSLCVLYFLFSDEIPFPYPVVAVSVIAFNPFFWEFKDSVISDIPFLFFAYLSLFLVTRLKKSPDPPSVPQTIAHIILGIVIYLSYGTRSIGIVLIPSLLIYDLLEHKRLRTAPLVTVLSFILFMLVQNAFLETDPAYYIDQFREIWWAPLYRHFGQLEEYALSLKMLWSNGHSRLAGDSLFISASGLAIIGYLRRITTRITVLEIFPLLYVVPIIVWPAYQGMRYLIPVVPLYIFYLCEGLRIGRQLVRRNLQVFFLPIGISIIAISYGSQFTKMNYGRIEEGIGKEETVELFDYVKKETRGDDVFIFRKPRALSLFTGRTAATYHWGFRQEELWTYLKETDAKYLIVGPMDGPNLREFVNEYGDRLQKVFSNMDFEVYKVIEAIKLFPTYRRLGLLNSERCVRQWDRSRRGLLLVRFSVASGLFFDRG